MYVLCSPCILNPDLRADGITKPSDIEAFQRTKERCDKFGIQMVPLPCPETLYLGPARQPGTFLERLDNPAFSELLDQLETEVKEIIRENGPPLCIIGVNSSPTCGVTATYYGSRGDEPPKRPGRGVFLSRFPGIPAIDTITFSRYRVYLAAPLFSAAERSYNAGIARLLQENFFSVHLPQDAGDDTAARGKNEHDRLFRLNLAALEKSDIVVAVIDGADADSGTSWEMGYAYAKGNKIIALRTDFRQVGIDEQVNLMLEQSAGLVSTPEQLLDALSAPALLKEDR
ncbi:nucleoside 2-deoxyribosyltransferase [Methanoregula sp.]|jgi:nucleoside 2-deoxyribosyltransferase/predicted secreted protein|uniref:nucleoside 2-deoxyribosyltransferase n=1 Tax=Methanoregula sp. TaxID=2052170 RepID=UPI00262A10D8|nr:nucleoside 2-deoxyribosyltransferase [Methanoregula sp.]MDD5142614.1 nucleoside 2-deoxyribosyltransferase [Methanoregula sp.]